MVAFFEGTGGAAATAAHAAAAAVWLFEDTGGGVLVDSWKKEKKLNYHDVNNWV